LLLSLDTGGTFTDALAVTDGAWRRVKVPSDGSIRARASGAVGSRSVALEIPSWVPEPARFLVACTLEKDGWRSAIDACNVESSGARVTLASPLADCWDRTPVRLETPFDAPLVAVHALVGAAPGDPLPDLELRVATTRGTNAMLERAGARVGLLVSEGFEDLLAIGDQTRPDLFARRVTKPPPLADRTVALPERTLADGTVRRRPTRDDLRRACARLRAEGVTAVAVSFVHALAFPAHERLVAEWLADEGFADVAVAGALSAHPRYLTRTETAVAHAAVAAPMRRFLGQIATCVPATRTFVLTSAGGLQRADRFMARDSFLSGPAGGVAGIAAVAARTGTTKVLGLDMGGTSADVARFDGAFQYRYETRVGPARVAAPCLAIETVAAGGGSIASIVRGEMRVGPASAGARPGPACYGLGGPLTLTDIQLLRGRIDPARATVPLSRERAEAALAAVLGHARAEGHAIGRDEALEGFVAVADERMASAIAAVTIREGFDPKEYALVPFGGAGGLHACGLADRLGMREIVFPADAGLLSARGLLAAAVERIARRAVLEPLAACAARLGDHLAVARDEARALVEADVGGAPTIVDGPATVAVRLVGHDLSFDLPTDLLAPSADALAAAFADAFRRTYGYAPPERALEVEAVTAVARTETPTLAREATSASWRTADGALAVGRPIDGPALLTDLGSTAYLAPGWRGELLASGDLRASRTVAAAARPAAAPAARELFAARVESIANAMGETLRRTAFSTNVKDRLDYSCAVLDARGSLVVNAPHLPVHLGAIGSCVRAVVEAIPLRPGDVAVTNHPAFGGSHLPDVTVITPVFVGAGSASRLVGYVANRAHHAEIGGTRPGSFPPQAASLAEEGVVIPPTLVVAAGASRLGAIRTLLETAPHPTRAVDENLADLEAAIAANALGARMLAETAERYGVDGLSERFDDILARSEAIAVAALAALGDAERTAIERLDDGAPIAVRVVPARDGRRTTIDFTGTGPTRGDSFNAPLAIVRSATLYALRLLVGEEIPLNEGLLRAIDLVVPEGFLNPRFDPDPRRCPPVVAGNTETSQRVVDTLLRAFGVAACSQGSMNNLLFGNERFGAYETIAGGSGATPDGQGADAVHTHMTNTRITDPEVFERRLPAIVREFSIRRGSGGAGRFRGGDGVIREIEFRERVEVSILAQHRVERPYGVLGGRPGASGRQTVRRADGTVFALPGVVALTCETGDAVRLETPGGGGWGQSVDQG
jgi:5-oxoprolinase (ATP-hydrolysing)